jgi:hypothetical protein
LRDPNGPLLSRSPICFESVDLDLIGVEARMEPVWGSSWIWGLSLIAVTIAVHAFGVVTLTRGLQRVIIAVRKHGYGIRHPVALTAGLVGAIGWVLAIFHGIEAVIWGAAYLWLGAIGSMRDAMLYSVDSITTRGSSGLELEPEWRLMGALEAADGMLLFGISTAFVFGVLLKIERIFSQSQDYDE